VGQINEADGAFYGPKIDIQVFDALKRKFQCGTLQVLGFLQVEEYVQWKLTVFCKHFASMQLLWVETEVFGSCRPFFYLVGFPITPTV
jgi:hypothetical protein